ncbi:hypothetical protein [Inquilinus sp. CA228]|uniref:hypothetical protein n=1 Tax=Inquilinus sp. CA228 TaxID=3455609 RepID=UPI003F8D3425
MAKRHLDLFELCVWAYQVQRVDLVTGRGLFEAEAVIDDAEPHRASGCGCAKIDDIARVGGRIDGGQWKGLNDRVHPDAVALADKVGADRGGGAIVAFFARLGDAPEWPATLPAAWPEVADRGRDVQWGVIELKRYSNAEGWRLREALHGDRVEYRILVAERLAEAYIEREWDGRRGRMVENRRTRTVEVPYCPLSWSPSIEWIMAEQGKYRRWHDAMSVLQRAMAGVALRDYVVTGFGAATYW